MKTSMLLSNISGNPNPECPFHIFGPDPCIGTCIDIVLTGFNSLVNAITITIKWLNLPIEGFDEYYRAYGSDITNDSFKIKMYQIIDHGKLLESNPFEFSLFQCDNNQKLLATTTIDYLLEQPVDLGEKLGIRLELVAPEFGFGQSSFVKISSEIALQNTLSGATLRQFPNMPFIPIVQRMTIKHKDGNAIYPTDLE